MKRNPQSSELIDETTPSVSMRDDPGWRVDVSITCDRGERDELWPLYEASFSPLAARAAQRHLMTRAEFDEAMIDDRVDKIVVRDHRAGDAPACLAAISNRLNAVHLVSPDYYANRWPEHYRAGRIWYITFVAVHPDYQRTYAIAKVMERLCQFAAQDGGIIAADICEFNEETLRFPTTIARLCKAFNPGIRRERLDAQVYWAYELPALGGSAAG
jgi:Acetyltransferase (GNAT) family